MRIRGIAVMTAVGLFALPALAGAAPHLTATKVRIGDHPTFVRVVIDFNRNVAAREVEFVSGPTRGTFAVRLNHSGVTTQTTGATGNGVRVALQPGTQALHITLSSTRHRFKYLAYAVVTGTRLAIDLWKSAPPPRASDAGVGDCLSLNQVAAMSGSGSLHASGTEHGVFEHTFRVVVRGTNGRVLGRRTVVDGGSWNTTVHYHATHRQPGTVEAVAFSAKDGSLACLAQMRFRLPAS
jgi:hypothetical protein